MAIIGLNMLIWSSYGYVLHSIPPVVFVSDLVCDKLCKAEADSWQRKKL